MPTGAKPRLPTLSVVMPSYNHARYLPTALPAHLRQRVPPLEVLVVDDASIDDSCTVVERLAATYPSLRLLRLPRNGGVNAAMNRGLREVRGDYVCFSAADDLVTSDFARRSLETVARFPQAGFCFSDVAILIGDSGMARHSPLFLSDRPCLLSPDDMRRFLRRTCYHLPSHSILYRRELLEEMGGFVEDLHWISDWFVNYVLAFRHGACYVPEVLSFFRISSESYSSRGMRDAWGRRAVIYRMLDLLETDAFRDVAESFRQSALIPDLRAWVLVWLLASRYRWYLTFRLASRLLVRGAWAGLQPWVPERFLRSAGRLASLSRRVRLAGLRSRLAAIGTAHR
jgi:glycosyltransferase involved in cell wall biosynthesis